MGHTIDYRPQNLCIEHEKGSDGEWRPATAGDKFCIPANEKPTNNNNQQVNKAEFQVGCKVPDHTGPLGEGWEVNHQWDSSFDETRIKPASLKNGEIDPADFEGLGLNT